MSFELKALSTFSVPCNFIHTDAVVQYCRCLFTASEIRGNLFVDEIIAIKYF